MAYAMSGALNAVEPPRHRDRGDTTSSRRSLRGERSVPRVAANAPAGGLAIAGAHDLIDGDEIADRNEGLHDDGKSCRYSSVAPTGSEAASSVNWARAASSSSTISAARTPGAGSELASSSESSRNQVMSRLALSRATSSS